MIGAIIVVVWAVGGFFWVRYSGMVDEHTDPVDVGAVALGWPAFAAIGLGALFVSAAGAIYSRVVR